MTIAAGDRVPAATVFKMGDDGGPEPVSTEDFFRGRRVVVFGLPGAFTRTCSARHLPGFVAQADAILARGVDEIACVSVNDAMVMTAWGMAHDAPGKVTMLSDGNCDLTDAMGLASDMSAKGYGRRSKRYAMIVDDGTVTHFAPETAPGLDVSSAEKVLEALG
ncbi:MAG: peroxiredoxin [Rhodospirillales bacterium CG15_BIG_FIL_POST_REV_8_21_14_020_66_15]|nr:MAG: peroxiredoxin [Rhodospirillales bacterium CG15_BIG_FIL_POST_REV_8_21_14_020_66_15]